jgi:hypothetical protein
MIRVVHPGSRIRMLTFSHPGSRIPDPDPQHWLRETGSGDLKHKNGGRLRLMFCIKNGNIFFSLGLHEERQNYMKSLRPQNRASSI